MSLCLARRSRHAQKRRKTRNMKLMIADFGSTLRPLRPLRETNFNRRTYPDQNAVKPTYSRITFSPPPRCRGGSHGRRNLPRHHARFAETTPGNCRDAHLAKSRQISANLGKSREISLCGGIYEQLRGLPVESDQIKAISR